MDGAHLHWAAPGRTQAAPAWQPLWEQYHFPPNTSCKNRGVSHHLPGSSHLKNKMYALQQEHTYTRIPSTNSWPLAGRSLSGEREQGTLPANASLPLRTSGERPILTAFMACSGMGGRQRPPEPAAPTSPHTGMGCVCVLARACEGCVIPEGEVTVPTASQASAVSDGDNIGHVIVLTHLPGGGKAAQQVVYQALSHGGRQQELATHAMPAVG